MSTVSWTRISAEHVSELLKTSNKTQVVKLLRPTRSSNPYRYNAFESVFHRFQLWRHIATHDSQPPTAAMTMTNFEMEPAEAPTPPPAKARPKGDPNDSPGCAMTDP